MAGHVFVVRGDLRKLACDAWLLPCDRRVQPRAGWFPEDHSGPRQGPAFEPGQRVQRLPGCPTDQPTPWLVDVGGYDQLEIGWYLDGVREFFDAVERSTSGPPRFGRAKRLIAMPLVGTGAGGAAERAGEVIQELLPELERQAERYDVDIAIVLRDAPSYAAAQAERAARYRWPDELTPALEAAAGALAERASRGELALFLGAGVSIAAGLPDWGTMLHHLAVQAEFSDQEREALARVRNSLDQATIVERRLRENGDTLGAAIQRVFAHGRHYAIPHALLAALPVREVITTNYDQLFESAWRENVPRGFSIVPTNIRPDTQYWLLKMHGCLSQPARIVLTRDSYTRYDEYLPALAGIVQAFLVTRHMLFVGFSLTDDNFHRVVDAVRRIRSHVDRDARIGTVVSLGNSGLVESLWEQDLHRVRMLDQPAGDGFPSPEAARRVEIFLDYLGMKTRSMAHLLVGPRYDGMLSTGERRLRDALESFVAALTTDGDFDSVRQTVVWPQIEQLLRTLGYSAPSTRRPRT